MFPLIEFAKLGSKQRQSHSILVDFQQVYIRNILLFCTGLSLARLLFGENIICQVDKSLSLTYVETKCFINGTFTKGPLYHNYYQWVPIYLLILAMAFYLPYSIWFKVYGDYVKELETLAEKPDQVFDIIKESKGNYIFIKTWALEIFYVIYVVFLIHITDLFLNRIWSQYQWSLDALPHIFPDNGTCFFTYYQDSGSSTGRFNCLLPLNSAYRKIFTVIYGLFWLLAFLNALVLMYRILLICTKRSQINKWWAFQIAAGSTISWKLKRQYHV